MISSKPRLLQLLAALMLLAYAPCKADVPPAVAPPPVPTDFCGVLWTELDTDLTVFNTTLLIPPIWTPVSDGPTVYSATLAFANANVGPQISDADYLPTVLAQLQEVKSLGVSMVSIPILFPILDPGFYNPQSGVTPYLTFYENVAQAARNLGLKVMVDSEIMFSNDIQAGWSNMNTFYNSLTWSEYIAARAAMAASIAQNIKPDYLVLANEPDTEAIQAGQPNLNIPADAAAMVAAEIAAVQALNLPTPPKLGAGFGSWLTLTGTSSLQNYISAYVALPLDYIDYHLLPVNTVGGDNFMLNAQTIASEAAAAGKAVAVGQAWLSKVAATEEAGGYDVSNLDLERSRQTFSFWQPLDAFYMQVMQSLASYQQMVYLDLEQTFFLASYQPYGGTLLNGGSLNCTCTTSSCSDYVIMAAQSPVSVAADSVSIYSQMGFSFYSQLVTTPDTMAPTAPSSLAGTAGTSGINLSWNASSDNIGVAGYNIYRCTPPAQGQPCTGVYLADTTLPGYADTTLTSNTPYNYTVEAYDFVNNHSPASNTLSVLTPRTTADSATGLVATVVSPSQINLSWSAPSNITGLGEYLVYAGSSPTNVQQIAVRNSTTTTYNNINLAPGTTYYYGIVAMESGIAAPMSNEAFGTTLPLPPPPSSVTGVPTTTKMAISWTDAPLPTGLPIASYEIYYGTTPGNLTSMLPSTSTTYTVTSLTPSTTYYFEITAIDTSHNSSVPSNQVAFTTDALPAAPVNVTATANSATRVTVTWAENVPPNGLPIGSFTLFRGPTPTGLTKLQTLTATTFSFTDTTAVANTPYYYGVEATDTSQDVSPMSTPAMVTTPPLPNAPTGLLVKQNSATQLTLTWSETLPPNGLSVTSYNVFAGTTAAGVIKVGTRTTAQFIYTGLTPSQNYYFEVQAVDSDGDLSSRSAEVEGTTPPMPAAPVNVVATANSSTQITVTWTENIPTGGLPITVYSVYWGTTPTSLTNKVQRTTTKYIATGLTPGLTYYYTVTATDSGGDVSPQSSPVASATTP